MTKINLLVGVVLGLIAVFLVNSYVKGIEDDAVSAPFFTLSADTRLSKGDVIEPKHLVVQALPEKFKSLTNLAIPVTADTRAWIVGRTVNTDIEPSSLLLHSHFLDRPENRFSSLIEPGKRAFSMPTNPTTSVAFFIEPGSRVDVIGTFSKLESISVGDGKVQIPNRVNETRSLLQNLKVLAVDRVTTRGGYLDSANSGFSTLTLEVTPIEAETLIFAQSESKAPLSFVLRNPLDEKIEPDVSISWAVLDAETQLDSDAQ